MLIIRVYYLYSIQIEEQFIWKWKKYKEALEDCNKAIEYNEKYAKAYLKRGEIKMELEEY